MENNNYEYSNFLFFGYIITETKALQKEFGDKYAQQFLIGVIEYGTTGKLDSVESEWMRNHIKDHAGKAIDTSKARYKSAVVNGNKKGAPIKHSSEEVQEYVNQGHTRKEAADHFGYSERTISSKINDTVQHKGALEDMAFQEQVKAMLAQTVS